MKTLAALVLLTFVCAEGWLFSDDPEWNDLKVTWGLNQLFSSSIFDSLPRKESDALADNWVEFNRGSECDGSFYRGSRYIKDNDPAVMLLFDKNGYIAGIQMGARKTELPPEIPTPQFRHMFNDDGDMLVITAYFTDPASVCVGRSDAVFTLEGTGRGLYLQNGPNPESDYELIPMDESDMPGSTDWTKGGCFYTMGQHYWFNTSLSMNCDDFFPVFLLYNSGRLNGFGFGLNADLTSNRYEKPEPDNLAAFFEVEPACLGDAVRQRGLTTMHIYMDDSPSFNFC